MEPGTRNASSSLDSGSLAVVVGSWRWFFLNPVEFFKRHALAVAWSRYPRLRLKAKKILYWRLPALRALWAEDQPLKGRDLPALSRDSLRLVTELGRRCIEFGNDMFAPGERLLLRSWGRRKLAVPAGKKAVVLCAGGNDRLRKRVAGLLASRHDVFLIDERRLDGLFTGSGSHITHALDLVVIEEGDERLQRLLGFAVPSLILCTGDPGPARARIFGAHREMAAMMVGRAEFLETALRLVLVDEVAATMRRRARLAARRGGAR